MSGPRVAAFGLFGRTNLGNEATFAAFLANVRGRYPGAEVACVGPREARVEKMHGVPRIEMEPHRVRQYFWPYLRFAPGRAAATFADGVLEPFRVRDAARTLRGFDALVIPGTGVLDDFGQGPRDLPGHLLRWCRAARRLHLPVFLLSVGAEPVASATTRRILGEAGRLCTFRSFRDPESREHTRRFGVDVAQDPVVPDLAFSLPPAVLGASAIHWPPKTIGLGVMGYYGWNRDAETGERIYRQYLDKMRAFVMWLLERGFRVRLLIGDTRLDPRPATALVEECGGADGRLVAAPISTWQDLLREINQTDLVIGTRFHNVLLGLLLGRPAVSVSYSPKNDALLEEFDLGRYQQPVEGFTVAVLQEQLGHLIGRPDPSERIARHAGELRARLDIQYRTLFDQLDARQRSVSSPCP